MTPTSISGATILHFCCFVLLNLSADLTCFKRSQVALQNSYFMLWLFEVKQGSNRIILVNTLVGQKVFGFLSVNAPQCRLNDGVKDAQQCCLKGAVTDLFYNQLGAISASVIPYDDCNDRGGSTGLGYKEVHGG